MYTLSYYQMKRPRTYHANSQKRLRSALRDAKYSTPRILELNTTDELQNYSYVVQNMLRKTYPKESDNQYSDLLTVRFIKRLRIHMQGLTN